MTTSDLTTVIMAGGKSSRMGTDKSFVPLLGKLMIEYVLEAVAGLGEEQMLITNKQAEYAFLNLPMYGDIYPDMGPLGGFHSALSHAATPYILVVACDMPWLNRPLLEYMVSIRGSADIIVPRWEKYPEPLHAIYSQECLEPITANLDAGLLKLTAFFEKVRVNYLERETIAQYDPAGQSFRNVNTPEELERAKEEGAGT
jgi:molybdopterin-guanine dinucleotide biosynthesis protein A